METQFNERQSAMIMVMATVKTMVDINEMSWDTMVLALLTASAYAAQQAGYNPNEYRAIIDSVAITSEEINLFEDCIGNC